MKNVFVLVEICTMTLQKAVFKEIFKCLVEQRNTYMQYVPFAFYLYDCKQHYMALVFIGG